MRKSYFLISACAFTLVGLSSAFAALPAPAYVDVKNGSNGNTGTGCAITTPCADLNHALSVLGTGGANVVIIVGGGIFGPVVLTQDIDIIGTDPNEYANIIADPTLAVGCIGHLPGSCVPPNNGYAVEFAGGPTDGLRLSHVAVRSSGGTSSALKFGSGIDLKVMYSVFNGGDTSPAVQIYPNNGATSQVNVYFAHNEISGGSGALAGAVEVMPSGSTSVGLHFNHMQVHGAAFGIRTDGSLIASGRNVSTFVSESEFFGFNGAAVNAFSVAGTGTVNAVFDTTRVLYANVALKANGPLSSVVLTNNTVSGNFTGVQVLNSATVLTSGNNTIRNNTTNISGSLTPAPLN